MQYSNHEMNNYVSRIKLTRDKKSSYTNQIDSLKDNVVRAINDMDNAKIIKVKRAGSWRKGTALAPKADYPLDVDMVFYIEIAEDTAFDAEELRDEVINVLCRAYPNKSKSDFIDDKKTIGVVFRGSGLEIDIVPFIPEKGNSTYGRQPRKKLNPGEFKTSVDKQLQFVADIKQQYSSFTSVVRIMKSWRNYQELELSSFSIELVIAHLVKTGRIQSSTSINDAIILFFELLGNKGSVAIYFSGAIGNPMNKTPWIADPTNNENNTLHLSTDEWKKVESYAEKGFETISYAEAVGTSGQTESLWKEIFGPSFNTQ